MSENHRVDFFYSHCTSKKEIIIVHWTCLAALQYIN